MFIYKIYAVGELNALIKGHPEHGVLGVWRYLKTWTAIIATHRPVIGLSLIYQHNF